MARKKKMLVTDDVLRADIESHTRYGADFLQAAQRDFEIYFAFERQMNFGTEFMSYFDGFAIDCPENRMLALDNLPMLVDEDGISDFAAVLSFDPAIRAMAQESNAGVVYLETGYDAYMTYYAADSLFLTVPRSAQYLEEAGSKNRAILETRIAATVPDIQGEWQKVCDIKSVQTFLGSLQPKENLPAYKYHHSRENAESQLRSLFQYAILQEPQEVEACKEVLSDNLRRLNLPSALIADAMTEVEKAAACTPRRS